MYRFTEGDHIEVTAKYDQDEFDFGSVRGTALDTRASSGDSLFRVKVKTGPTSYATLTFNLNHVEVVTLFRADVARSLSNS